MRLPPRESKPGQSFWLRVVLVMLGVAMLLAAPFVARDAGKHSPSVQFTEAPKKDESDLPLPKPTSGFLTDRGAER